jgi:CRISPR-associated protein Csd1
VSFNAKAFESQGWKSSENASIIPSASQAIATALNRLMDPAFETQEGRKLPKRFEHIAKDTVIAYWPKGFWVSHLDENQGSFSNLLASHWKGIKPNEDDASEFHAFTLSGSQGRIIVRDHFETTASQLYKNLDYHYQSLQIEPLTLPGKGKDAAPTYGTNQLLESTVLDGKRDNISPPLAVQFYQAIHKGPSYPFPESLIHKALRRSIAEIHEDSWKSSHRADIRAGLLKAYLIRNHQFTDLTKAMNPQEDNFAYLMGRIFSSYGEMQRLANLPRTVNADLTTKNYAKFFARPLATYAALGEPYQRHLKTALKSKGGKVSGLARRLNTEVEAILGSLGTGDLKETFNTKEQALFTLAFHHQNHWHRQSSDSRIALITAQDLDPFDPALLIAPIKESKTEPTT